LTAASCPKKDFYTPPPPKNLQQTFVLQTQNSVTFVLRTQKSVQKTGPKKLAKRWQKGGKKSFEKGGKKVVKKTRQKTHCHLQNTHAIHQKKNFLKHIPEFVLLPSRNQSKTGLFIFKLTFLLLKVCLPKSMSIFFRPSVNFINILRDNFLYES